MIRKILYSGSVVLMMLITNFGFCQPSTRDFRNLFEEVEFDIFHIYTLQEEHGHFPETSMYPFKGREISSTFVPILTQSATYLFYWDLSTSSFFACQRFYLTMEYEGLLVREYLKYGWGFRDEAESLRLLIFDNKNEDIIGNIQLAYNHKFGGSYGLKESWLIDINWDGSPDIITRSETEIYPGKILSLEYAYTDSTKVMVWSDSGFVSINIEDNQIKKNIKLDFPYYERPQISYDTRKVLFPFLENERQVEFTKYRHSNWRIVTDSFNKLNQAQGELNQLKEKFKSGVKYGLDKLRAGIFQKKGQYFIVLFGYYSKVKAELALSEVAKMYPHAFLVNIQEWCPLCEDEGNQMFNCIDSNKKESE